ncbi:MAG TPA: hypothetical protein PLJ30_13330 [Deltaproteobacteria bacterium]|nr:hypothetical protein [Deltaproteobacteria bacterium]HRR22725.1 hypothetical protein [Desulfomonilia bacterium]
MRPLIKGIAVAAIHVCLIGTLGAKLVYDRATLPRVWASTVPRDPDLPLRGRYVSLQLVVTPNWFPGAESSHRHDVTLRAEDGSLMADIKKGDDRNTERGPRVRHVTINDENVTVLSDPVAFFIPEHVPDPSLLQTNERLWVEATIPNKGAPRPIRLGVSKNNGPIEPLNLR